MSFDSTGCKLFSHLFANCLAIDLYIRAVQRRFEIHRPQRRFEIHMLVLHSTVSDTQGCAAQHSSRYTRLMATGSTGEVEVAS